VGVLGGQGRDREASVRQARADESAARLREKAAVEDRLAEQLARQDADDRYRDFVRHRDEAQVAGLYGTLSGCADQAESLATAGDAAHRALARDGGAGGDTAGRA